MPLFSVSYILLPKHLIRIDLPIDRLLLFYYPSIFPCGCYLTLNLYKSLAGRHGDALAGIARQHLIQYRTLGSAECLYDCKRDTYELNEAAYNQIKRVADMLAAMACFSRGNDKREEQLFNTLSFAAELLEQSLN